MLAEIQAWRWNSRSKAEKARLSFLTGQLANVQAVKSTTFGQSLGLEMNGAKPNITVKSDSLKSFRKAAESAT